MLKKMLGVVLSWSLVVTVAPSVNAQGPAAAPPARTSPSAGGNSYDGPAQVRYQRNRDPLDRRIDMFMADWRESNPRHEHGSLVLRDILTRGDNFAPIQRGAVLERFNSVSRGVLAGRASTTPSRLTGQQEIFYILSGKGEIKSSAETSELRKDIGVFIPAGVEFTMRNTGDEPLTMIVVNEPTAGNFKPREKILIRDERKSPIGIPVDGSPYNSPGASGHWAHITRGLFSRADGLAAMSGIITVTINPLTLGEPHTHEPSHEEIWVALEGTSLAMLGAQIRMQRPGMAFMLRPDETMLHANINHGETPVKFLWFSGSRRGDARAAAAAQAAAAASPKP